MKKDLLVSIATIDTMGQIPNPSSILKGMDGPRRLNHTIKMLYDNCHDKDSFTLQVIINSFQEDVYKEVLNKWNITPDIIEYQKYHWENLYKAQHEKMKEGYYFFMFMPDDLIGLSKDWDKAILDKKHHFSDDLFSLYTKYERSNRNKETFSKCYKSVGDCNANFEEQPVWTYKFGEFFIYLFKEDKLNNARELLIAVLIHLLNERGFNRHVGCDMNYEEIICQNNNSLKGDGYKKYLQFLRTDEKDKIVEKIIEYIKK